MRRLRLCLLLALVSVLPLGCGNNGFVNAKGRVIKNGRPYLVSEGQGLRMFFAPTNTEGTRYDSYAASYDPEDGTFEVIGKDGRGLPPGTYRIGLQLMEKKEDLLDGKLMANHSPFLCTVTDGREEIVIDLDQSPFDKLLAKAASPKNGRHR